MPLQRRTVGRRLPGADAPPAGRARAARGHSAGPPPDHAHRFPGQGRLARAAADELRQPQPRLARPAREDARDRSRLGAAVVLLRDGRPLVRAARAARHRRERARRAVHHLQRELQRPDRGPLAHRGARAQRRARRPLLRALLWDAVHRHRRHGVRAHQRRAQRGRPAPVCRAGRRDRRSGPVVLADAQGGVSEAARHNRGRRVAGPPRRDGVPIHSRARRSSRATFREPLGRVAYQRRVICGPNIGFPRATCSNSRAPR